MSADGPDRPSEQAPEPRQPRIGADEWVASHEGAAGAAHRRLRADPEAVRRSCRHRRSSPPSASRAALVPLLTSNGYVIRVGFDTLLYMLLALGLNITVGYAGLLDLGYVAFYGFGAYGYAMLASDKFGIHWPTAAILPLVVTATVLLGFLVALPSRRLVGDYLAIVTLFFGQLFVTVVNNGNRISILGFTRGYDVTGGPNGIADIEPVPHLRREPRVADELLLRRADLLPRRAVGGLPRQHLAHRPRVALAARGLARGRADGHARQPAEARRVRVRRGRRRADGHACSRR